MEAGFSTFLGSVGGKVSAKPVLGTYFAYLKNGNWARD